MLTLHAACFILCKNFVVVCQLFNFIFLLCLKFCFWFKALLFSQLTNVQCGQDLFEVFATNERTSCLLYLRDHRTHGSEYPSPCDASHTQRPIVGQHALRAIVDGSSVPEQNAERVGGPNELESTQCSREGWLIVEFAAYSSCWAQVWIEIIWGLGWNLERGPF